MNGKVVSYNFKKGDSVRFGNHSIFITGVNGNNITFAQCNADGHCAIDWDATTYNGQTITASYLRAHLSYIDRPMMTGDLNLDGVINSEDVTVFDNTLKKDGATIGDAPAAVYDTNYDGVVNETDYNRIKNMSGSTLNGVRYVNATKRTVTPIWMNTTVYTTDYTFMTADGNFYSTENGLNGGATFYGNFNTTKTNVTVPATVTNPKNNTTYQVTSVGYYGGREPGNKLISKIKTLNLPYTVRQINRYAFWNAALQNIKFPSNSTLKTVEDCAFMHAESLNYVQFPPSLETIGSQAFDSCKQLVSVYMTPDSTGNGKFRSMGDGAFLHCPNLWKVRIANNKDYRIFIGENGSVFDDNDESIRLELPNTIANNPGILHFAGASDVAKWRNVTLHIDCGNYIIYDNNYQVAATHPSTAISSVYPN